MPQWLERASEGGLTPETVSAVLDRSREVTVPDPESLFDSLASANGLTAQTSTFARADVIKAVAEALPEGGKLSDVETVADAFLQHSDVIPILPTQPNTDDLRDLPIDLSPTGLEQLLDLTNSTKHTQTMRRGDGDIFPGLTNERRYTTTELLTIEQRIVARAEAGIGAGQWTATEAEVDEAVAHSPTLTEGQRVMVHQFATSGNAIDIGVGAAGTGKTTVMAIVHELAAQAGTPVVGAALAARTAAGFEAATGIRSATITRFLGEAKATGGLPTGVVVIVDEAGMVGSRQIAAVFDLVEAASGKLILIGDHHQLAEIDAGGLFRALVVRVPAVELTENVRQDHEWERTALAELRHGSVNRAVAMYDRRGRINIAATTDDTIDQAVHNWYRDVKAIGDLSEVLLIGHRNTTVDQLNERARSLIAEAGLLGGPTLNVKDRLFQTGERVVCLKNRSRLGVLNGDFATVTGIDIERRAITLRLDRNDHSVAVPPGYLDDGHLDWEYALTGHKAQGVTVRRAHTVAGDGVDREWIYVTMSRGQEANTVYLTNPELDHDECTHLTHQHLERVPALIAALGRTAGEPAALDTGRGPRILTDEELNERLVELKRTLRTRGAKASLQVASGDGSRLLADYVDMHREARSRQRDRLAAAICEPPGWIVDTLGERPSEPGRRAAWDAIVDRALRHRTEHGIPNEAPNLLGPEPPSGEVVQRIAWTVTHRAVERDLRRVMSSESRGLSAIGR